MPFVPLWLAAVLVLLALVALAWYRRHPTVAQLVLGRRFAVPEAEAAALAALLADAGLPLHRVRVVAVDGETPCWSWRYRSRWDRWLRVDRQFGRFGEQCVGVSGGHVVGISLVETALADMAPLARLLHLRHVQLRGARLTTLTGVPEACHWSILQLQSNQLEDLSAVVQCPHLGVLDASFNRLATVPPLAPLARLHRLDLRHNDLTDLGFLTGHPSLEHVDVAGNPLGTPAGVAGLPRLAFLNLTDTALTTLRGLRNLPALRSLQAAANLLTEIDADVLTGLPALRSVSLDDNNVVSLPEHVVPAPPPARGTAQIIGRAAVTISLLRNPVAETWRAAPAPHRADLPRGRGSARAVSRRGRMASGVGADALAFEGQIGRLDGTHAEVFAGLDEPLLVTATASVTRGGLRLFLADPAGGVCVAEAHPGQPARLRGRLLSGSDYFLFFESIDGPAHGIAWTAEG